MRRAIAVLIVGGLPAVAPEQTPPPTPSEVAVAIADTGWYADPESVGDREQLAMVADRLANQGEPMGFALLAAEPAGSSPAFAEDVLDTLAQQNDRIRTVVVLSDADVGVVSDVWSDTAIDNALDDTIDDLRADPTDGLESLADALAAEPTGFDDDYEDDESDSGPNTGLIVFGVLALAGVVAVSRYFSDPMAEDGDGSSGSSWSSRRRRSSWSSSSRRSFRSSGGGSSRRSSGGSRGRGGRRL